MLPALGHRHAGNARRPAPWGTTLAVARREAIASFHTPIAYVVLVLFLVVEGFSFWAVVQALADPRRPAPYGAVLRSHFGGNFLYFAFLFFVVAVITMRLIAEERRQGTWELLLASPVSEAAVVVGKWLGALLFYCFLWAPTCLHLVMLKWIAATGAAPDPGPIASAYGGVLVSGAAFLAVGVMASAASASQLIAAVVAFSTLVMLFLGGLAPEIAPTFFAHNPLLRAVAHAVDVRKHMDDFARGIVDTRHLVFYAGTCATALAAAVALASVGRNAKGAGARNVMGVTLVAAAALLSNVLAARHPLRTDVTRTRVYSLHDKTRQVLAEVGQPVRALILQAGAPEFAQLYDEVREILARFQAEQPLITLEELDPALDPARVRELAEDHALSPDELAGGGAVVLSSGGRRRAVALLDMARFAKGEAGGVLESFRGEAELAAALLEITDENRPEACFTTGHGELGLEKEPGGMDLSALRGLLERDGMRVRPLAELAEGVPARCAVLAIVGPTRSLSGTEAMNVHHYLSNGGRLLIAASFVTAPARGLVPTGLELILLERGIRVGPAIVVDPAQGIGIPLAWGTTQGYGEHPISAAFAGRRLTAWVEPRWVESTTTAGSVAVDLVSSSENGWGETDSAPLREGLDEGPDARDVRGPVGVAVASETPGKGTRIVALGSARSFTTDVMEKGIGENDAFATSAMAWLTGRRKLLGIGPKTPEQFRLVLTAESLSRLFLGCVVWIPSAAGLLGVAVLLRRRGWRSWRRT
ncbi:MAG: Gldg family protein [Deltaproteobacteria bacterium]|nr:Gldg family protein [Deltaproteobacteria bacterium]